MRYKCFLYKTEVARMGKLKRGKICYPFYNTVFHNSGSRRREPRFNSRSPTFIWRMLPNLSVPVFLFVKER